jgi:DNA-binding transcriptional MerR regulator
MRIGELARESGVSTKAVRYYESMGLIRAERLSNGYRDYRAEDVRMVREIRDLGAIGIRVEQARPFLDCLVAGHGQGDDCPDAVATYRAALAELEKRMSDLAQRRAALTELLESAAARAEPLCNFTAKS